MSKFNINVIGGLIFVVFFYFGFSKIPDEYYQVRDDGLITMSHARNWIDFGFIGTNPSGDRVEGFSAPTQFFLYALIYGLTKISYDIYTIIQTVVSTFILGALFISFFSENKIQGIVLTIASAFLLSLHMSFLQWHGSGMENALTHVLFLATILILYKFIKYGKIVFSLAIVVFFASISRLESVYHIAPLLFIFSLYWYLAYNNLRGFYFSAFVFILWSIFNIWRFLYFGDLSPNTAYAQNIIITERLRDWLNWNQSYIDQSIDLSKKIFLYHGGYFLITTLPLLIIVRRDRSVVFLFFMIGSLVITSFFNPFIFGPTRLDPVRSTTYFSVLTMLTVSVILYNIENKNHQYWIFPYVLVAGFLAIKLNAIAPYDMCCTIKYFDGFRKEFAGIAEKEQLPLPTIANPDLGVMSWHKQYNIVDLGMLGTPIMAKLKNDPMLADYFFDYVAPDMIESHEYWTCHYYSLIFSDSRFREKYDIIREALVTNQACGDKKLPVGIWIRKDIKKGSPSSERILIDDLAKDFSLHRIRQELDICQSDQNNNCIYVARTAYRFLPEIRRKGLSNDLKEIFVNSKTKDYDLYLINGYRDGQAHERAIAFIKGRS